MYQAVSLKCKVVDTHSNNFAPIPDGLAYRPVGKESQVTVTLS